MKSQILRISDHEILHQIKSVRIRCYTADTIAYRCSRYRYIQTVNDEPVYTIQSVIEFKMIYTRLSRRPTFQFEVHILS